MTSPAPNGSRHNPYAECESLARAEEGPSLTTVRHRTADKTLGAWFEINGSPRLGPVPLPDISALGSGTVGTLGSPLAAPAGWCNRGVPEASIVVGRR